LGQEIRLTIHLTDGEGETPAIQKIKRDESRQQQAEHSIHNDPNVQTLIELFDAQVLPGTIKPN
jgi:DNA polymerase-3 subunit gamma/tau